MLINVTFNDQLALEFIESFRGDSCEASQKYTVFNLFYKPLLKDVSYFFLLLVITKSVLPVFWETPVYINSIFYIIYKLCMYFYFNFRFFLFKFVFFLLLFLVIRLLFVLFIHVRLLQSENFMFIVFVSIAVRH